MKKLIYYSLVIFITGLTLSFIYVLFTTNNLEWDFEGIVLRVMALWILFSVHLAHSKLNQIKIKSDFNYVDILYRLKKKNGSNETTKH